jgi:molybdopterin molybdotransferase
VTQSLADIAAGLQGYDPQALSIDAASAFLAQLAVPVTQVQTVSLLQALERVLAHDVLAPFNVPPHHNSAMDGYAFDGAQLQKTQSVWQKNGPPVLAQVDQALTLKVVGSVLAGASPMRASPLTAGQCVKVTTGAVMPAGLDTVVPQEFVSLTDNAQSITIPASTVKPGDNRRLAGEDLKKDEVALPKGAWLQPAALGLLASLGVERVAVLRRLRVAYFSTGSEIVSPGELPTGSSSQLPEGKIFDSNRYTLFGLLTRLGCEVIDLGVVPDDPVQLEATFAQAADQADAIITSGGVSVGEADHTKAMMKKMGDVAFWRVAMRPGRPMAVGHLHRVPGLQLNAKNGTTASPESSSSYENNSETSPGARSDPGVLLFGLPGNPVAVMVTFLALVRPALLRMMGRSDAAPPLLKAHATAPIRKKPGRTEYQRGQVSTAADGSLHVTVAANQGSGVLSSMVRSNGLVVLHHTQTHVAAGELVDVMVFEGAM